MAISDEEMVRRLETVRPYIAVLLRKGPAYQPHATRSPEQAKIVAAHGRRNMEPQDEGRLPIVGPFQGDDSIVGLAIFSVGLDEVTAIMEADVAVKASIFTWQAMTLYGFPGNSLPPANPA